MLFSQLSVQWTACVLSCVGACDIAGLPGFARYKDNLLLKAGLQKWKLLNDSRQVNPNMTYLVTVVVKAVRPSG